MNIYPWQEQLWLELMAQPERLPHALLLAGPEGLGKRFFAQALAARLLCEAPVLADSGYSMACGQCDSCRWLAGGNHPDFRLVQPEADAENPADASGMEAAAAQNSPEERQAQAAGTAGDVAGSTSRSAKSAGKAGKDKASAKAGTKVAAATPAAAVIRIDQVRALSDFVYLASHRQGRRIIILQPAEAMNPAAANALLKILEEPPSSICFLLVSSNFRQLLPTLRSRCRQVHFGLPSREQAAAWLQQHAVADTELLLRLAGGSPLLAQRWALDERLPKYRQLLEPLSGRMQDPLAMASHWQAGLRRDAADHDVAALVMALQKWLYDLIQLKLAGRIHYHQGWQAELGRLAQSARLDALLACQADLLRMQAVARHPLNPQLFLEDLAMRYLKSIQCS